MTPLSTQTNSPRVSEGETTARLSPRGDRRGLRSSSPLTSNVPGSTTKPTPHPLPIHAVTHHRSDPRGLETP